LGCQICSEVHNEYVYASYSRGVGCKKNQNNLLNFILKVMALYNTQHQIFDHAAISLNVGFIVLGLLPEAAVLWSPQTPP
jgi:hypothetical protein